MQYYRILYNAPCPSSLIGSRPMPSEIAVRSRIVPISVSQPAWMDDPLPSRSSVPLALGLPPRARSVSVGYGSREAWFRFVPVCRCLVDLGLTLVWPEANLGSAKLSTPSPYASHFSYPFPTNSVQIMDMTSCYTEHMEKLRSFFFMKVVY